MAQLTMSQPPRRKSIVQTLVSSLEMKFDEESETNRLEAEIAEEEKPVPESKLSRFRRKGALVLHSKQVLMAIALLNVIDCLLVTGELILDIQYIKEILEESDLESQRFVDQMQARYPDHLSGHDIDHMGVFHNALYLAKCYWDDDPAAICGNTNQIRKLLESHVADYPDTTDEEGTKARAKEAHAQNPWVDVAHGLHKASIVILGLLFLENIFKIFFMGRRVFHRKIEVFDAFVVFASFVLDLVFLKGLIIYRIQDGVLILSFLLPWRVIRVVNSLIVAVIDHEHFRLKMMYKEKKKLANGLEEEQEKVRQMKDQLRNIEDFLEEEGMPRWKFVQYTRFDDKKTSVASMVSLALKGVMGGVLNFPCYPQIEELNEVGVLGTRFNNNNNNTVVGDSLDIITELDKHDYLDSQVSPRRLNGDVRTVQTETEKDSFYIVTNSSIDEDQVVSSTGDDFDFTDRLAEDCDESDAGIRDVGERTPVKTDITGCHGDHVGVNFPYEGYVNAGFTPVGENGEHVVQLENGLHDDNGQCPPDISDRPPTQGETCTTGQSGTVDHQHKLTIQPHQLITHITDNHDEKTPVEPRRCLGNTEMHAGVNCQLTPKDFTALNNGPTNKTEELECCEGISSHEVDKRSETQNGESVFITRL